MWGSLSDFYKSKLWTDFRALCIAERTQPDGFVYDEVTGRPIVKAYDIIAHHKIPLTLENVNDFNISLNPDNIQLVSFKTHNEIHERFGVYNRHVYLVYGCPLAGKTSYVKERAGLHDLVIDIDKIYQCITNNPMHVKSARLYDNMRSVEQALLGDIQRNNGRWINAFIIGGYPYKRDREDMFVKYGAEPVHIECDIDTAINRLKTTPEGRDINEYTKYITQWFNRYQQ
jgi:hypothetical protein